MKIGSKALSGGGNGDSSGVAPKKGGKMNIENNNARGIKGKKKGPLGTTKPAPNPTHGMGQE